MTARVVICTAALSLLIAIVASSLAGGLMRLAGLKAATSGQVMLIGAATSLMLAPVVLTPLVSFAFRWQALRRRLETEALTDPLTGIANRRAFFEHVAGWTGPDGMGADGPDCRFALLMIDVDHFKQLNDQFGHKAGDLALAFIAGRVRDALARAGEPEALVARMGGEEFAVFLPGVGASGAALAARAVCEGLRVCPFSYEGTCLHLTVSVGVWAGTAADVDGPLAQADRAAYAAKAAGRDRWMAAGDDGAGGKDGLEDEAAGAAPRAA